MRANTVILEDLQKARADYHEAVQTEPAPKLAARTAQIKKLTNELSEYFSEGAEPCPDCDNPPHGMQKNRWEFEVGCLHCQPQVKRDRDGRVIRTEPRVRSGSVADATQGSREEAVALWNAGERMERQVEG